MSTTPYTLATFDVSSRFDKLHEACQCFALEISNSNGLAIIQTYADYKH